MEQNTDTNGGIAGTDNGSEQQNGTVGTEAGIASAENGTGNADSAKRRNKTRTSGHEEQGELPAERIRKPREKTARVRQGGKNRLAVELDSASVKNLAEKLAGLHELADTILGTEKIGLMALKPAQAEQLSESICDIIKQYDFQADPKVMAWLNFLAVVGVVYGSKFTMFLGMKKLQAEIEKQNANTAS